MSYAEYGTTFALWHDYLFPKGELAADVVDGLEKLHPGGGAESLEVGVGTGRVAVPLARRVGPIVGLDVSELMLGELENELSRNPSQVAAVQGDIVNYRSERMYDFVYCVCQTLCLLTNNEDLHRAWASLCNLVVPGGRLVLEVFNSRGIEALHGGLSERTFYVPYPEPGTGLETRAVLENAGRQWSCEQTWYEGSEKRTVIGTETCKLFTPKEVEDFANMFGFKVVATHADWGFSSYREDAPTFNMVFTRV